jgi:ribonucleoside-diphosphate reductase alpha chain
VVGAVKSAGVRRGAALANLKTGHPDLIKFIKCKEDQNQINNFNLSVAITDAFMEDVIQNRHTVWAKDENDRCYTAAEVYDMIVEHMWNNGEPGVQFIDTVNNVDGKYIGRPEFREFNTGIEVSNPCGETFLKPNEACNLASINLYHFVNPFWKGKDENKDMALRQELKQTVEDAVDFLNLMLDKSETPFDEINEAVHQSRKVGLGVMGLADYLSAKGIVYGSPEAVHEAADVFAFISKTAEEYSLRKGYKNATLTVQAPTGTTGLVGEVSTGIEPHFLRCWNRHSLKMGDLLMYPKSLRDYIKARKDSGRTTDHNYICWYTLEKAMYNNDMEKFSNLIEGKEYYNDDHSISDEIKKYWPTAHEVTQKQHLAMLAAIQRHVHNSVSKTINLPHDATVDDVRELITTAWRSGCKGFTCYRDGSRDSQPLKAVGTKKESKEDQLVNLVQKVAKLAENSAKDINVPCKRPRPDTTYGETVKTKIGCGSIYITVNKDENGTCEVFTNLGRAGGCPSQSEATCRLISLALRSGVKVEDVIDQLKGIRCMNTMRQGGIKQADGSIVLSCPDAIGKAIEKFHKSDMEDGLFIGKMRDCTPEENAAIEKYIEKISVPTGINIFDTPKCPECGEKLTRDGGCIICRHCGYSKCG